LKHAKRHINSLNTYKTIDAVHGRIEEHEVTSCNDIDWLIKDHSYPHIVSIMIVKSRRYLADKWSQETRYFISSIKQYAHYVGAHWGVENNLHWTLNMAFDEDSCRMRKRHSDQNMAILRRISFNLLKSVTEHKVGIKIKRQMSGWDSDYLLKVLQ
jgi:predicted transposase YbfD/YdcC